MIFNQKSKSLLPPITTAFELLIRVFVVIGVAKVVATNFGAPTFARYTAYSNIFAVISVFSVAAVNSGMIQHLADNRLSAKKSFIGISRSLIGTFCVALNVVFFSVIAWTIFNFGLTENKKDGLIVETPIVLYLMVACLMYYVVTSYTMLLNISRDLIRLAIYRIAVSIFLFSIFLILVEFLGETGAYLSIPIGYVIVGFIILFSNKSAVWRLVRRFRVYFSSTYFLHYIKIGGILGLASILGPFVQIVIRNEIISGRGIVFAGYWDALWRVSDAISTVGVSYLLVFLIPILAQKDHSLFSGRSRFLFLLFSASYLTCVTLLIYNKEYFVKVLYSDEFIHITEGLLMILIGGYFRILGAAFNYSLLIKGSISRYFTNELVCSCIFALGVIFTETVSIYNLSLLSLIVSLLYASLSYLSISKNGLYESVS